MPDSLKIRFRELLGRIVEHAPPEFAARDQEAFLHRYFADVPPEDILGREPGALCALAIGHLKFGSERPPRTPAIRTFNPDAERDGWSSSRTIVQVVTTDMPFLVDSVGMELNRRGLTIHLTIHPVFRVRRDESGHLRDVALDTDRLGDLQNESFLHIEFDRISSDDELLDLTDSLRRVLGDIAAAVEDWHPMREQIVHVKHVLDDSPFPDDEVAEAKEFLDWLANDNFTFLGYREYDLIRERDEVILRIVSGSGLGILRESRDGSTSTAFSVLPPEVRERARIPSLLILTKANARSTVHRPAHIDYVGIKRFDRNGEVNGEFRFLGLYTSAAYRCEPSDIPVVRRKLQVVARRFGLQPRSHREKTLQSILQNYPRDELFQITTDLLYDTAMGILHLQERQRVRLFVRHDDYHRFVSCLVFVSRDRYDTALRERFQKILSDAFQGTSVEFNTLLGESMLARIHFILYTETGVTRPVDITAVERELAMAARTWDELLGAALLARADEEQAAALRRRYRHAFPAGYREDVSADTAARDITFCERLHTAKDLAISLYRVGGASPDALYLKLYRLQDPIPLSDALPVLEKMGLRVIAETPYRLLPEGSSPVWLHEFRMIYPGADRLDLNAAEGLFRDTFAKVWTGQIENDGFNRLVLAAGLTARQVNIMRAYCRYMVQLQVPFSQSYMASTLVNNSNLSSRLVGYFETRFRPKEPSRDERMKETEEAIENGINEVTSLDEDRILRLYLSAMRATLRTNYYQVDDGGQSKPDIVFKIDPGHISAAPRPRPRFEIFVYSPRVEGTHLRGGKVARGGIRWSDRREDFRTEILGLMKAQMVKNAVIVPVGAKGGFVAKRAGALTDRGALRDEVLACYRAFIHGLLDVTDNVVETKVVPPADTVRHDDDDPYLVVAADKGTAAFSDVANEIAMAHGFWLGDAFASGGSSGYDHKGMGITARGAWESVKRHFRELGVDIQTSPFTVVGIGDMSGDVFGNGMLLSPHTRLIAAFNHQHIFLDPEPDPETSFAERKRLFELPSSTWMDYDRKRISTGGGVFSRQAKSISIGAEMQHALAIDRPVMTPNELIVAILKAPVDLLWNGGIGTFVKANQESDAEVGDRVNDPIRVNGRDLRCRVVGEGGNLGFTQLGRIEYSRRGGCINTDAIDNSGGVDCSDHEVNIKTLLRDVVASGELTVDKRNRLLVHMTDEVADLVLTDNYHQAEAISVLAHRAEERLEVHSRLIRYLERNGKLDRELEFLPGEDELKERAADRLGLTRPELAVLLSYAKITIYEALLGSDVPEDPYLSTDLLRYFPAVLTARYPEFIRQHPLRREITATYITNNMVNSVGITMVQRFNEQFGFAVPDVIRAYAAARDIFDMSEYRKQVESLDTRITAETQVEMLLEAGRLVERATLWLLQHRPRPLPIAETVQDLAPDIRAVSERLLDYLVPGHHDALAKAAQELEQAGVPADLARRCTGLGAAFSGLDVVEVAHRQNLPMNQVAEAYFALGDALDLYWVRQRLSALATGHHWDRLVKDGLYTDLYRYQRRLTADALAHAKSSWSVDETMNSWMQHHQEQVTRVVRLITELRDAGAPDLAMLTAAVQEVKRLVMNPDTGITSAPTSAPG